MFRLISYCNTCVARKQFHRSVFFQAKLRVGMNEKSGHNLIENRLLLSIEAKEISSKFEFA